MQPTSSGMKSLRRSLGVLSLAFMAATGTIAQSDGTEATTTMSKMLGDIERQANAYARAHNRMDHILFADPDQIHTTAASGTATSLKMSAYFRNRDIALQPRDNSMIEWAMGGPYGPSSSAPQAFRLSITNKAETKAKAKPDSCIIIPETANLSSRSLIEKWIGRAGPYHLQAAIDPGPYTMALRVAWHETWHCLDQNFVQAYDNIHPDKGFEFANAVHSAEMFADVAATLTLASRGNIDIVQQTADMRAISSRWNGPKMMAVYSPKHDSQYYSGITYYTTPAHDAVLEHINRIGMDTIKRYTLSDIERIATDITRKHALNNEEFRALAAYLKKGAPYLRTLTQRATDNDAVAKRNLAVITAYTNRTDMARSRVVIETKNPVLPQPDIAPPDMNNILSNSAAQERDNIKAALQLSIESARKNGLPPRQGILNQFEQWRSALHTAREQRKDLEHTLHLASLMLINGDFDQLLYPRPTRTRTAAPS